MDPILTLPLGFSMVKMHGVVPLSHNPTLSSPSFHPLSASWFIALHAAVPFIGILRKSVLMPKMAMVFTIAASVMGQMIGSRAERYRLKSVAQKKLTLTGLDKVAMKWNPMLLEVASPVYRSR